MEGGEYALTTLPTSFWSFWSQNCQMVPPSPSPKHLYFCIFRKPFQNGPLLPPDRFGCSMSPDRTVRVGPGLAVDKKRVKTTAGTMRYVAWGRNRETHPMDRRQQAWFFDWSDDFGTYQMTMVPPTLFDQYAFSTTVYGIAQCSIMWSIPYPLNIMHARTLVWTRPNRIRSEHGGRCMYAYI